MVLANSMPIIFTKYSVGIICINAISMHIKYPIQVIGFAFSFSALLYSYKANAETIANIASITYLFPKINANATIGNPISPVAKRL